MFRADHLLPILAGLLSLGTAARADAAPVTPDKNATASVSIHFPATIRKLQDLHFAYLSVTAAGTATVDPNTDLMTTTGGVLHISGLPYAALFEGVAPSGGVVIIRIPRDPIVVTRMGGTETMVVSNWTVSGNGRRTVASQQPFNFKVGGTLHVNAGQAEGVYTGTFTVDIQYP
jgi:hypothetical protein